jgi:hypothetical protein
MPPTTETALLRQKVELLERIIQGIENERNDLRRRLDAESEARENAAAEIRRLTLMLTHSPKIEPEAQPVPTANQNDRPRWSARGYGLRWPPSSLELSLLYGWPMAAPCPDT